MADYLQLDGVDDWLLTPSMTFDDVTIDCKITDTNGSLVVFTNDAVYAQYSSGTWDPSGINYWNNGVFNGTATIGTRSTIRVGSIGTVTRQLPLFGRSTGLFCLGADVYGITVKNGSTVVAQYDFTTGNANDISGNGKHATLTGGTFVSSGSAVNGSATFSGTGTLTATGQASLPTTTASFQGVGSLTATGTVRATSTASFNGTGSLTATGTTTGSNPQGSATFQGTGTLAAIGSMLVRGSASFQGVGTLTASGGYPIFGSSSFVCVGSLTALGVTGSSIAGSITLYAREETSIALSASEEFAVHLYALETNSVILGGGP